jgi:predicted TIM-barrel fold metal-dependent hydrolase
MDAQAVDLEVLSINPFWYGRERDLAAQIVKIQNEKLAELCASKPDRFAAFASLTLQAPDLAVQELETAVKKQGYAGKKQPWEEIVMTTRRHFLKAGTAAVATGIVFCSCGLLKGVALLSRTAVIR